MLLASWLLFLCGDAVKDEIILPLFALWSIVYDASLPVGFGAESLVGVQEECRCCESTGGEFD